MRRNLWSRRLSAVTAVVAGVALSVGLSGLVPARPAQAATAVSPRPAGELDCNGLSPIQRAVKSSLPCLDPRGPGNSRFEDNEHYIGHDEPSVRFISRQPGSGSSVTYNEQLPVEPAALPTVRHPGKDVTHSFELTVAPWFSITVCDPHSAPLTPCRPDRTPTPRPATARVRVRPSWSCSSTRRDSRPLPTASAATTLTGAPR